MTSEKKAAEKQKKATKQVEKNSYNPEGEMISENIGPNATDVFAQAMKVAGEATSHVEMLRHTLLRSNSKMAPVKT